VETEVRELIYSEQKLLVITMSWRNMDEEVMTYLLNEILESDRCVEIFRVMMEYEDFEFNWLMEQFLCVLETLDEYALTDRSGDFVDAVRKLNFRKMDAATGETGELDESSDEDAPNYDDDFDDYTPMY